MEQWIRATTAMRQEPEKHPCSTGMSICVPHNHLQSRSGNLQPILSFARDFQNTFSKPLSDDPLFWFMLVTLPVLYGSVHLTAWNFEFPTYIEKIMWRVACTDIAGGIPLCFAILLVWLVVPDFERSLGLLGLVVLPLAVLSIGARLFIITESFISVRKLPIGVFITVDWSTYIPHL